MRTSSATAASSADITAAGVNWPPTSRSPRKLATALWNAGTPLVASAAITSTPLASVVDPEVMAPTMKEQTTAPMSNSSANAAASAPPA